MKFTPRSECKRTCWMHFCRYSCISLEEKFSPRMHWKHRTERYLSSPLLRRAHSSVENLYEQKIPTDLLLFQIVFLFSWNSGKIDAKRAASVCISHPEIFLASLILCLGVVLQRLIRVLCTTSRSCIFVDHFYWEQIISFSWKWGDLLWVHFLLRPPLTHQLCAHITLPCTQTHIDAHECTHRDLFTFEKCSQVHKHKSWHPFIDMLLDTQRILLWGPPTVLQIEK